MVVRIEDSTRPRIYNIWVIGASDIIFWKQLHLAQLFVVVKTKFYATTLLQYLGYWHKRFKFLRRTCYAIFIVVDKNEV